MLSRRIANALVTGQRAYTRIGFGHNEGWTFRSQPEDQGHKKPKYDTNYDRTQLDIKKDLEYERLLIKEQALIRQLEKEGRAADYNPSLEPGTICLKAIKVPYWSPQLKAQTPEQTAAARANIRSWQAKIDGCKPEEMKELVEQLIAETPYLVVMRHSKKETATSYWESQIIDECRYSGLVPGVEGYVTFQHRQNEELMEEFVEISGVTEFPQVFAGGKSVGCWRTTAGLFNSGAMIPLLESVGLKSKQKGTHYYENIAMVKY